jgi:hypothetical protein
MGLQIIMYHCLYFVVIINDSHSYINHFVPFMKYVNDNQLNQHFKFVAFNEEDPPPVKHPIIFILLQILQFIKL